jgi:exodeoxyribonuclease VIII
MTLAVDQNIKPGIYQGIPNESYHEGPGISKSGLFTIGKKSPAHFKFGKRKEKTYFDFGEACHLAILQPNEFEVVVIRGPDDRRGNKWTDKMEMARIEKKLLLTSGDYDNTLAIRDVVHADPWINSIVTGGEPMIEASGYFTDPVTGEICRIRPDLYRKDLRGILDVKSTKSAHPDAFAKSVIEYGYHAQEAFYSDGWQSLDMPVDWFAFLTFEKEEPFAFAVYELPPSIVEEGRVMMRKALDTYHECKANNRWPAYGDGVQELSFNRWAYRHTEAPNALDEEQAAA